jgi:thioredoxin-like negative regulator of GroEL
LAVGHWTWHLAHPLEPIQLLAEMQQQSAPVTVIGRNDKPTVVDFWAPWCENCKLAAPTLRQVEEQYGDSVNFVMVNGDLASSWPYIEAFGVDAIPHLALISAAGDVETALIGPVPKHVLTADIDALLQNSRSNGAATVADGARTKQELPYKMLDVFAGKPDAARRIHFDD